MISSSYHFLYNLLDFGITCISVTIATTPCDTCHFQSMMWFRAWKLRPNVLTLSWERSRTCFTGTCHPRNTAMVKRLDFSRYITCFIWRTVFVENVVKVERGVAKWCMFTVRAFTLKIMHQWQLYKGTLLSLHSLLSHMMELTGKHTLTVLAHHFLSFCKH
jgi:hypothetical protein